MWPGSSLICLQVLGSFNSRSTPCCAQRKPKAFLMFRKICCTDFICCNVYVQQCAASRKSCTCDDQHLFVWRICSKPRSLSIFPQTPLLLVSKASFMQWSHYSSHFRWWRTKYPAFQKQGDSGVIVSVFKDFGSFGRLQLSFKVLGLIKAVFITAFYSAVSLFAWKVFHGASQIFHNANGKSLFDCFVLDQLA